MLTRFSSPTGSGAITPPNAPPWTGANVANAAADADPTSKMRRVIVRITALLSCCPPASQSLLARAYPVEQSTVEPRIEGVSGTVAETLDAIRLVEVDLRMAQEFRQFHDPGRHPARSIAWEQFPRRSAEIIVEIKVRDCLTVLIPNNEAEPLFVDGPRWRESASVEHTHDSTLIA
jgi:hypothetical protein